MRLTDHAMHVEGGGGPLLTRQSTRMMASRRRASRLRNRDNKRQQIENIGPIGGQCKLVRHLYSPWGHLVRGGLHEVLPGTRLARVCGFVILGACTTHIRFQIRKACTGSNIIISLSPGGSDIKSAYI